MQKLSMRLIILVLINEHYFAPLALFWVGCTVNVVQQVKHNVCGAVSQHFTLSCFQCHIAFEQL